MKKYYLYNGTDQQGPFDIEELKAKKINKDTPIWYEGISDWMIAGKVEELKGLFNVATPPPFGNKQTSPPINKETISDANSTKKKSNALKYISIAVVLFACIFFAFAIYENMGGSGGSTYQEKVMTVEEIERSQPANFLTADGNYNENFWGDKLKVHGIIKNKATVATYKDAVVRITYYSKTKTELGNKDYTIYEVLPPHSEVKFELKIDNYKNVNTIGWDVIQATAN